MLIAVEGPTFRSPSSIAKFAIISFATTIISSASVLAGFVLADRLILPDSFITWLTWWLADAAGTLLIAPAIVLWATMLVRGSSKWDLLESVAVSILVIIIGILAYRAPAVRHFEIAGVTAPRVATAV